MRIDRQVKVRAKFTSDIAEAEAATFLGFP